MRASLLFFMFLANFDALLMNDDPMTPIATFVLDQFEKLLIHVKKERNLAGSRRKIRELSPSPSTSEPLGDEDFLIKEMQSRDARRDKKHNKKTKSPT